MGVERSVTRWYARRQQLLNEIALLEEIVAPSSTDDGATISSSEDAALVEQLAKAREKLRLLGPCPKPMMG